MTVMTHPRRVSKANPLWDGDGVQGAGQPRDRLGRWITLPGPTSIARLGVFENSNGEFEVRSYDVNPEEDGSRPQKILRTYKSKAAANKFLAGKLREDADAYQKNRRSSSARRAAAQRRQQKDAESRAAAEADRKAREEEIFGPQKKGRRVGAPSAPLQQNKPKPRNSSSVQLSEMDRLENPGRPNPAQVAAANSWAKENLPRNEQKYSELVTRLLQRRGITQDPKVRGEMSQRYGIPAKRLIEIEQQSYDVMFPKASSAAPRKKNHGVGAVSPAQVDAMNRLGARRSFPEANPENTLRSGRYFKINKGPQRGKWGKVSWNGSVDIVDDHEAEQENVKSKLEWSKRLANRKEAADRLREQRKASQQNIDEMRDTAQAQKEAKIAQAKKWAESEGLDPDDSYWWAMYWNDMSLLKNQTDETDIPLTFALAEVTIRNKAGVQDIERLLALPDISSRDIRGHRPGPKKAVKGDDDFEEAGEGSRRDSEDWRSRQREIQTKHDRRSLNREYKEYLKTHPRSKMTFETWKKRVKKVGKALTHWDGDGVQGPGQRRDRRGRWSDQGGALRSIGEGIERNVRQHHGSTATRSAAKGVGGPAENFDSRKKTVTQKIKTPQKGSTHQVQAAGVPVKRTRKNISPESAYYERNKGAGAISDKRLVEIYQDRSKITPEEHDLITAAAADVRFDGDKPLTFRSVRAGGEKSTRARWTLVKDLRTQLGQDYAKQKGLGGKGAGGQVRLRDDSRADKQREKDNQKRAENKRNTYTSVAKKQELLLDFGDGEKAKCIFCGRPVRLKDVSPERMKPGPIGGKYERGNVAPAHVTCNTKMGTAAQHKPDEYYDEMMKLFEQRYAEWIEQGYLRFVFGKHRSKLSGRRK